MRCCGMALLVVPAGDCPGRHTIHPATDKAASPAGPAPRASGTTMTARTSSPTWAAESGGGVARQRLAGLVLLGRRCPQPPAHHHLRAPVAVRDADVVHQLAHE